MIELKSARVPSPARAACCRGQGDRRDCRGARYSGGPELRVAGHPQRSRHRIELLQFIERLRELSGGKPTGFKFCLGHPWSGSASSGAMMETGITPDFIVVDGSRGGTGAAPVEFIDHVGVPLREALLLVHNTLLGTDLRHRVKPVAPAR